MDVTTQMINMKLMGMMQQQTTPDECGSYDTVHTLCWLDVVEWTE